MMARGLLIVATVVALAAPAAAANTDQQGGPIDRRALARSRRQTAGGRHAAGSAGRCRSDPLR
jgi:hypothetical protein